MMVAVILAECGECGGFHPVSIMSNFEAVGQIAQFLETEISDGYIVELYYDVGHDSSKDFDQRVRQ